MRHDRQYAKTVEGIRPDHVARYRFAAQKIPQGSYVIDAACGCGYGSWILEQSGLKATGVDLSDEALEWARRYYKGPTYLQEDVQGLAGQWDALVTFETLEHLKNPLSVLRVRAPLVIASVPNEERYPFRAETFKDDEFPHLRHYTPKQFDALLTEAGLEVKERFCQRDKLGEVVPGTDGMFLIYVCKRLPQR